MPKLKESARNKGRWLVLEQTSPTKEEVLALIRTMEGAEIQIVGAKTYVRFPKHRAKTVNPVSRITKVLCQKRAEFRFEDAEIETQKQYCAIMLKSGR